MGPGGPPGLQNRSLPANAGGLGSTPRRFRQTQLLLFNDISVVISLTKFF